MAGAPANPEERRLVMTGKDGTEPRAVSPLAIVADRLTQLVARARGMEGK